MNLCDIIFKIIFKVYIVVNVYLLLKKYVIMLNCVKNNVKMICGKDKFFYWFNIIGVKKCCLRLVICYC